MFACMDTEGGIITEFNIVSNFPVIIKSSKLHSVIPTDLGGWVGCA